MELLDKVKSKVSNAVDLFFPVVNEEIEEEDILEEAKQQAKTVRAAETTAEEAGYEVRQVANGAPEYFFTGTPSSTASEERRRSHRIFGRDHDSDRPKLTLHTTKVGHLNVHVYAPSNFDQVTQIADDIRSGKGAVVNYEKLEGLEQRRICDFLNGACYVLDATPKRVSSCIVLYVPKGVEITEADPVKARPE